MSHPAINLFEVEPQSVTIHYKHAAGDEYEWNYPSYCVRAVTYRSEPESTNNPIRPDGTRAPSAYFIKTIYFRQKSSTCELTPPPWGWYVKPASQVPTWDNLFEGSGEEIFGRLHVSNVNTVEAARVKFLNKLGDTSGKDAMSLGAAAGEFRETCGMAADLAGGLVRGVLGIARDVRKPGRVVSDTLSVYGQHGPKAALRQLGGTDAGMVKAIVDGWLVYQLGLRPLMYDVIAATSVLNAAVQQNAMPEFQATIRSGHENVVEFDRITQSEWLNGCPLEVWTRFQEIQQAHFAAVYKIPTRPTTFQRLGLYNVPSVAWELVRYSWMVDYITNTGPWLRSLLAGQDCVFVEGTLSVLGKTTVVKRWSLLPQGGSILIDPAKSPETLASDSFERTVLGGVRPAFLPQLNNRLDATKLATSLAALTNLVGSRSRNGEIPVIKY